MQNIGELNNIIFTDIDGVLNSECYFIKRDRNMRNLRMIDTTSIKDTRLMMHLSNIDLGALERLKSITEATNSKIVVTSEWVNFLGYNDIKNYLLKLGVPIIDEINPSKKGTLIKEYLNKNHVDNYIIIDYIIRSDYDNELLSHLIKTELKDGLMEEEMNYSVKLLKSICKIKTK